MVYDDFGNVSFSFIIKDDGDGFGNFKWFIVLVLKVLYVMGVIGVMMSGCNDLLIDGKKFLGNVMYVENGWMFFYGMLMYDVD